MAAIVPTLALGSLIIPQRSVLDLRVSYEDLEGSTFLRMSDGSINKITIWQGKRKITLDGSGKIPPGLQPGGIDYTASFVFKSPAPRAILGSSNIITVPAGRRTDLPVQVIGVAVLAGYEVVETAVSLAVNVATLTIVPGAVSYEALYFPQITVLAKPAEETLDTRTSDYRWTMELLEV